MNIYFNKYIKYKNKYNELKSQNGGNEPESNKSILEQLRIKQREISTEDCSIDKVSQVLSDLSSGNKTVLLLDGIHNEMNAATVIRNCGILGATDIFFCPRVVDIKAIKSKFNSIKYTDEQLADEYKEIESTIKQIEDEKIKLQSDTSNNEKLLEKINKIKELNENKKKIATAKKKEKELDNEMENEYKIFSKYTKYFVLAEGIQKVDIRGSKKVYNKKYNGIDGKIYYYYEPSFITESGAASYKLFKADKPCSNLFYNFDSISILEIAKELGYTICLMENYADADITKNVLSDEKILFIVGNESLGTSTYTLQYFNLNKQTNPKFKYLYIPTSLEIDGTNSHSLNVAESAVITMYARQKDNTSIVKNKCDKKVYKNNLNNT